MGTFVASLAALAIESSAFGQAPAPLPVPDAAASVQCALAGTVEVYRALGSEIFVRELLIDGQPHALATGPRDLLK